MRLSELNPGSTFIVSSVLSGGEVGKRLADMGFTQGAEGELIRDAFLRGPVQVRICGYDILIRRGEAKLIEVEQVTGTTKVKGERRRRRGAFWGLFSGTDCCGRPRGARAHGRG